MSRGTRRRLGVTLRVVHAQSTQALAHQGSKFLVPTLNLPPSPAPTHQGSWLHGSCPPSWHRPPPW